MKRFVVVLLALIVALASTYVHAESLREQISSKLATESLLESEDSVSLEHEENPFDYLTSNHSGVTSPEEYWQQIPDWARYLSGCVVAILGLVICFFGVRFIHLSVFVLGGFIAAVIMYGILGAAVPNDTENKTAIVYGTSFAMWVVVGGILACCISVAVFVLGAALGAVVALVLNPVALKYVWPEEPMANMIIWIVVFGLLGGLIACCLEKALLILATSAGGAFALIASIMAMAGTLNIGSAMENGVTPETTWQDWAGFGGFIGLAIFGSLIQACITAKDYDHNGYHKLD